MSQCLTCGQTGRIPPARLPGPVHFTGGCITSPACVTAFRWCPCWILPPYPSDKPTFLRSEHLLQGNALLMPNNTVYLSHFNAASKFGTHSLSSIKALIHLGYGSFSSAHSSLSPAPDFVLNKYSWGLISLLLMQTLLESSKLFPLLHPSILSCSLPLHKITFGSHFCFLGW